MDISSKTALELYFADNFETVLFPILAEQYLQEKDFDRADKVCDIGLKYHPDHPDGLYMAARAAMALGDDTRAEQFLKTLLNTGVYHFEGLRLLADVQQHLQRSIHTRAATWKRIKAVSPQNKAAEKFFEDLEKQEAQAPVKKVEKPTPERKQESVDAGIMAPISEKLATFTMVAVLNDQGLYHQALEMLDILESLGKNPKRIHAEREKIKNILEGISE